MIFGSKKLIKIEGSYSSKTKTSRSAYWPQWSDRLSASLDTGWSQRMNLTNEIYPATRFWSILISLGAAKTGNKMRSKVPISATSHLACSPRVCIIIEVKILSWKWCHRGEQALSSNLFLLSQQTSRRHFINDNLVPWCAAQFRSRMNRIFWSTSTGILLSSGILMKLIITDGRNRRYPK